MSITAEQLRSGEFKEIGTGNLPIDTTVSLRVTYKVHPIMGVFAAIEWPYVPMTWKQLGPIESGPIELGTINTIDFMAARRGPRQYWPHELRDLLTLQGYGPRAGIDQEKHVPCILFFNKTGETILGVIKQGRLTGEDPFQSGGNNRGLLTKLKTVLNVNVSPREGLLISTSHPIAYRYDPFQDRYVFVSDGMCVARHREVSPLNECSPSLQYLWDGLQLTRVLMGTPYAPEELIFEGGPNGRWVICLVETPTEQIPGLVHYAVIEDSVSRGGYSLVKEGPIYRVASLNNKPAERCGTCAYWSRAKGPHALRCAVYPEGDAGTCKEWAPLKEAAPPVNLSGVTAAPSDLHGIPFPTYERRGLMGSLQRLRDSTPHPEIPPDSPTTDLTGIHVGNSEVDPSTVRYLRHLLRDWPLPNGESNHMPWLIRTEGDDIFLAMLTPTWGGHLPPRDNYPELPVNPTAEQFDSYLDECAWWETQGTSPRTTLSNGCLVEREAAHHLLGLPIQRQQSDISQMRRLEARRPCGELPLVGNPQQCQLAPPPMTREQAEQLRRLAWEHPSPVLSGDSPWLISSVGNGNIPTAKRLDTPVPYMGMPRREYPPVPPRGNCTPNDFTLYREMANKWTTLIYADNIPRTVMPNGCLIEGEAAHLLLNVPVPSTGDERRHIRVTVSSSPFAHDPMERFFYQPVWDPRSGPILNPPVRALTPEELEAVRGAVGPHLHLQQYSINPRGNNHDNE